VVIDGMDSDETNGSLSGTDGDKLADITTTIDAAIFFADSLSFI